MSLRQQNALHETISLPQPGFVADLGDHGGSFNSLDHSACQPRMSGHVIDIIKNSKTKARTMVHVAMQVREGLFTYYILDSFLETDATLACILEL